MEILKVYILAVTAALDKTDNEHIAKELTRIIYTLTSKESNQGRGWCSLICNCDGLRILIKMLDATVEFVVTLSGNLNRIFKQGFTHHRVRRTVRMGDRSDRSELIQNFQNFVGTVLEITIFWCCSWTDCFRPMDP